jgi:hypothetical protein
MLIHSHTHLLTHSYTHRPPHVLLNRRVTVEWNNGNKWYNGVIDKWDEKDQV